MSTPHKCPKCNGTGWLQFNPQTGPIGIGTSCGPWVCDVCHKGIIWEQLPDIEIVVTPEPPEQS